MNKLLLGIISLLLCLSASLAFAGECLTDNGDGTLTDPNTGLIWQNCAIGEVWDGKSCTGLAKKYDWGEALLAADGNQFQDKNDWILPTKGQYEGLLKSYCKSWTNGVFWSSSKDDVSYAWHVNFKNGVVNSDNQGRNFAVRVVRASQLSDIGIFKAALNERKIIQKEKDTYKLAKSANTVAAFTDFLNNFPSGFYAAIARSQLEEKIIQEEKDAYKFAKSANTVAAFTDFLNKFPSGLNATMAKAEIDTLLYEPVKRANNVAGYIDYLKKNPYGDHAPDAKEQINIILKPSIIKAEAAFKCEEARQIDKSAEAAGMSHLSDFDDCVGKRKFNNVINLKNPQQQYLEAVKYENEHERNRAKRIYLTIMDKFSTSPVAIKAADRLTRLSDVENVESSARQAAQPKNENCGHLYAGRTFKAPGGFLGLTQEYEVVGFSENSGMATIRSGSYSQQVSCSSIPR